MTGPEERPDPAGGVGVKVMCGGCGAKYRLKNLPASGKIRCKHCGRDIDCRDGTEVIENPNRDSLDDLLAVTKSPVRAMIPTPSAREGASERASPAGAPHPTRPPTPARTPIPPAPPTTRAPIAPPPPPAAKGPAPAAAPPGEKPRPTSRYLDENRLSGIELGGCRIDQSVGRGGMGVVYRATHLSLGRTVAVKVLARAFSADERQVGRFRREGRAAAKLNHPNVTMVHDIDEKDGLHYIIMEFIQGTNLEDVVEKEGPIEPMRLAEMMAPVADALHAAHQQTIVHRDIKPANLILSNDGIVKITDFGLARDYGAEDGLTRTGQIVGTPHFMSPEQGEGLKVEGASDIYSLGCTLYFLLTGKKPFEGNSAIAIMVSHLKDKARPPHELDPTIGRAMSDLVVHMMAKQPADRPKSMAEVASRLRTIRSGPPAAAPAVARPAPASGPRPAGPSTRTAVGPATPRPGAGGPMPGPVTMRAQGVAMPPGPAPAPAPTSIPTPPPAAPPPPAEEIDAPTESQARRKDRRSGSTGEFRRMNRSSGPRTATREGGRVRRGESKGTNLVIPIVVVVACALLGLVVALLLKS